MARHPLAQLIQRNRVLLALVSEARLKAHMARVKAKSLAEQSRELQSVTAEAMVICNSLMPYRRQDDRRMRKREL